MSEKKKKEVTGHQRQEDIVNVVNWIRINIQNGDLTSCDVSSKAAAILQLSRSTIIKYCNKQPEEIATSTKKRERKCKLGVSDLDDFTKSCIRNIVYQMYAAGKHVTIHSILMKIRENEVEFYGRRTSLYKLLLQMGFAWHMSDGRKALLEPPHILSQRIHFLRNYIQFKSDGVNFVFLDETWVFSKGVAIKTWQDGTRRTMKRKNLDQGTRYVILHAGSREGFIEGVGLLFSSGTTKGDYHGDMNSELFEKWLEEQLLPSLQEPSVIVLDNASYSSAQVQKNPTTKWKKGEIKIWLDAHHIDYEEGPLKQELHALAVQHKPPSRHRVDEIIRYAGHNVLRLPPYHCQYNPIEMVWSQCKRHYNKNISSSLASSNEVKKIWEEAIQQVTAENWMSYIEHCEKPMKKDWNTQMKLDTRDVIQPIVITGPDESETDDELSDLE